MLHERLVLVNYIIMSLYMSLNYIIIIFYMRDYYCSRIEEEQVHHGFGGKKKNVGGKKKNKGKKNAAGRWEKECRGSGKKKAASWCRMLQIV